MSSGQMAFLFARVHVRPEHPLFLSIRLLNRPQHNLIGSQFKAWTKLFCLDRLVRVFFVHMVTETDEVIPICKGHDALCVDLGHW